LSPSLVLPLEGGGEVGVYLEDYIMNQLLFVLIGVVLLLLVVILIKLFVTKPRFGERESIKQQGLLIQEIKVQMDNSREAQKELQRRIEDTKEVLNRFSADYRARLEEERATRSAIKAIESLLIGSRSKGKAGENIVAEALSNFPQDMIQRNFRVNNNPVEFALRLPNNKVLPIDAKFTETDLLERLEKEEGEREREKIIRDLNKSVVNKVKEVSKYIDPAITETHCIAAIPDSVFSICSSAYYEAYKNGVILMSYSMTVPYLLTYLKLREKYSQSLDLENLNNSLLYALRIIEEFNNFLEGYMADAVKRVIRAFEESKKYLNDLNLALAKMRIKE
jgi:DNA recombination protein RmuC